jgi:HPt (histidine-containing phosphotransfer) domain-containing protein
MPTPSEDDFAAELVEIRRSFMGSVEARMVRLRELLTASDTAGWTLEAEEEARGIAHKLAGSCGSFGFAAVGDAALRLEEKLIDAKAASQTFLSRDITHLIALFTRSE